MKNDNCKDVPSRSANFFEPNFFKVRWVTRSIDAGKSPGSGAWRFFCVAVSLGSGGRGCLCLCVVVVVGFVGFGRVVSGGFQFQ